MAASWSITEATVAQARDSRTSRILSYLVVAGGMLTVAVMLYLVVISYSPLPHYDQWSEISFAAEGGDVFSPDWLWKRWAEHRHVLPKLFYGADLCFFQCRQKFLLISIFVIQLLHLALLSWSMRRLGGWRGALWLTGTGLAAFCLFYPSQYDNFIWGWQVCYVLALLLATLSFVGLMLYASESKLHPDKPSPKFLAISILAALGSAYSLANGNLLWPILVLGALYLRLRRRAVAGLVIVGAVSTGLYFYHYIRPGRHDRPIFANIRDPFRIVRFCAEYLFGTWTHHGVLLAVIVVLAELAVAGSVIFLTVAYMRNFRLFGMQLILMLLFWVVTAMLTAAGRSSVGSTVARESRYQSVILLCWCCVGLLLLGCAYFARPRIQYGFLVAQCMIVLALVGGTMAVRYPLAEVRRHAFILHASAVSLLTRVYDPKALDWIYPGGHDDLLRSIDYLRDHRLSIFAGDRAAQLGQHLQYVYPVISFSDCSGAVESMVVIQGPEGPGLRLTGWAWDTTHRQPAFSIVVTTDRLIRGLGAVGGWHAGVQDASPTVPGSYMGYIAYVPLPRPGSVVSVYAVLHARQPTVCFIGSKFTNSQH